MRMSPPNSLQLSLHQFVDPMDTTIPVSLQAWLMALVAGDGTGTAWLSSFRCSPPATNWLYVFALNHSNGFSSPSMVGINSVTVG
jgi:hypothetical protein